MPMWEPAVGATVGSWVPTARGRDVQQIRVFWRGDAASRSFLQEPPELGEAPAIDGC